MRRFINSMVLIGLDWSGPLLFITAWMFLIHKSGWINALLFCGLVWTAKQLCDVSTPLSHRYIAWRVAAAKKRVQS